MLHLLVTQLPVSNFNSLNKTLLPKDYFWFYGFHIEKGLTNNSITLISFNSLYATSFRRKLTILLEYKLCNNVAGNSFGNQKAPTSNLFCSNHWLIFTLYMFIVVLTFAEEEGSSKLPAFQWCSTKDYLKERACDFHIQRISGSASNPFKLECLCKQDHTYATTK